MNRRGRISGTEHAIDRMVGNVQTGHFERSALCEFLALPENRVTLADEKDSFGLPVANFSYSQCDNDKTLAKAAQQVIEDLLHAAGADEVITIQRYAHLVGGARMAADEQHGVVDANNRSFAIPNL